MKKLLKISIVGLTILLSSCESLQVRYEIPKIVDCRLLSESLFCINQSTGEEIEVPLSYGLGFRCTSPSDDSTIQNFGEMIMLENIALADCVTRRYPRSCLRNIIKKHNRE